MPVAASVFNPTSWGGSVSKIFGDIKDDDPITQGDLRTVSLLGFAGGMATQGLIANKKIDKINAGVEGVTKFKYLII